MGLQLPDRGFKSLTLLHMLVLREPSRGASVFTNLLVWDDNSDIMFIKVIFRLNADEVSLGRKKPQVSATIQTFPFYNNKEANRKTMYLVYM